jgi:O-antigen/teichoic acid export membrane protein
VNGPTNLRQAHWGFLSQIVNTGTNFLLTLLVARVTAPDAFGAFAVVMVLYTIGIGVVRATSNDVLAVRRRRDRADPAREESEALAHTVAFGILLGLAAAAVVLVIGHGTGPFLLMALVMPMLLLQEGLRGIAMVRAVPKEAALSDVLWAVAQFGTIGVAAVLDGRVSEIAAVLGWCAGGSLGAVTALVRLHIRPRFRAALRWFVLHRALAAPLLATHMLTGIPVDASFLLMPLVTDLSEVGALRAAFLFFGPLGILILGTRSMLLPDATRLGSPREVRRLVGRVTAVQAVLAAAWGAGVVLLPDRVGRWLLDTNWDGTQGPRTFLAVMLVAEAVLVGAIVVASALGQLRRALLVQATTVPIVLVLVLVVASGHGATGTAAVLAGGYAVSAVLAWLLFLVRKDTDQKDTDRLTGAPTDHRTESGTA